MVLNYRPKIGLINFDFFISVKMFFLRRYKKYITKEHPKSILFDVYIKSFKHILIHNHAYGIYSVKHHSRGESCMSIIYCINGKYVCDIELLLESKILHYFRMLKPHASGVICDIRYRDYMLKTYFIRIYKHIKEIDRTFKTQTNTVIKRESMAIEYDFQNPVVINI